LAHLATGDFARGWAGYEARLLLPGAIEVPMPRWDGRTAAEWRNGGVPRSGSLLLDAEQGLGDTIQFIRYAAMAAERGWHVFVRCPTRLHALVRTVPGVAEVRESGADATDCACSIALMSLPLVFGTTEQTIPASVPYIRVPDADMTEWRARAAAAAGIALHDWDQRLNVGLTWAGDPRHDSDRQRSMPLAAFAPLVGMPGVRLFALQRGPAANEARAAPGGLRLIDVPGANDEMAHTAALAAVLDLVITVDTSVAHLAGALGRPVWTLLMFVPDWRWMLNREDSPWYPTMRLFRQRTSGDWPEVAMRVAEALQRMAAGPRRTTPSQ
jgi:hypothetical protein